MKPILTVLALILTSTLYAQQRPERAPREPRAPRAERQEPLPQDARAQLRERLRALREARSRQDGDERQEQGTRPRPGAGRGEGGRGPRRHGHPGHGPRRHHGEESRGGKRPMHPESGRQVGGRPEGGRREAKDSSRDTGPRGGLPGQRMAQARARMLQLRSEWAQRFQQRARGKGGRDV